MNNVTRQDIDQAMSIFYMKGRSIQHLQGRRNPPVLTVQDRQVTKSKKNQKAETATEMIESQLDRYCQLS